MKRMLQSAAWLLLLTGAPVISAQVQIGDDLRMRMSGSLSGGYSADYGDQIPSSHGVNFGADAQISGDYYNPNFLNYSVSPYYNRSTSDSDFQSLTNSSGVNGDVNLFTGSRYPGSVSFNWTRNSTGNFGLVTAPNFTTIGTGYGFGIAWSILLPNKPTLSFSYSQGSGGGNVFGTNEETHSSLKTLNLRSNYHWDGWNLGATYQHLSINSQIPTFLSGENNTDFSSSAGNYFTVTGSHALPWSGGVGLTYSHSNYYGDFSATLDPYKGSTDLTTNSETANISFHPTNKFGFYMNQSYTDNLDGFLYQSLINNGSGVPLSQENSNANSLTVSGGATYNILPNLFTQAQITYFQQSYFGHTYDGSFLSATVGYNKRILNTFALSATLIESNTKFTSNSLGYILNLNAFRHFGAWELSGNFSYAQNQQTLLVTYTTSYYNYSGNVHRSLGRGKQWTAAYNGTHNGLTQEPGSYSRSDGFTTSLSFRRYTLGGNYVQSKGLSILTSTGIQPLPPTPGLPPLGQIVYNGESYSGFVGVTPLPRMSITVSYSHAKSNTLAEEIASQNRTEVFYAQLQYRLRRVSLWAGYTKFSQGISAAGTPPGNTYSYFIGVTRWLNFF